MRLAVAIVMLILSSACSRSAPVEEKGNGIAPILPSEARMVEPQSDVSGEEIQRRIVYEADLELVVKDVQEASNRIAALVDSMGGYVVNSSIFRTGQSLSGNMTVRVPVGRFRAFIGRVKELAIRVNRESIRARDVTSEYVDLQARLKNLEVTEEELRALLSEVRKKSGKASDIMQVYRELTRIRTEIERIKGRMQVLDRLTTYATVNIRLIPYELSQPVSVGWSPLITLHRAWKSLLNSLRYLVDFAIYLVVVVLPIAILILLPIILIARLVRRFSRRRD